MNVFFSSKKNLFSRFAALLLCLIAMFSLFACSKTIDYFNYVSELRSNILVGKTETFSLRIYAVSKESPYATDGIPRECFSRLEAYLVAPEGNKTTNITLQIDERSYGGEMSYDMVKGEYFYSCSADVSAQKSIQCLIKYGEEEQALMTSSVLTENTIKPQDALKKLQNEKTEFFSSLTDRYGFAGEIYLRLICEGSPYYYIGIIDRKGNCNAFLMNAETGKILAQRQT